MKKSWEMTQQEFADTIGIQLAKKHAKEQPESWYRSQSDRNHRQLISKAIKLSLPVPPKVLEEYEAQ